MARMMLTCGLVFLMVLSGYSAATSMSYSALEEEEAGYVLGSLKQDSGLFDGMSPELLGRIRFGLLPGPYQQYFSVDEVSGILSTQQPLDRDTLCPSAMSCTLNVEAAIVEPQEEFQVLHLVISVRDTNDNSPQFSKDSYKISLSESSSPGSRYILPTATDPDSGTNSIQDYHLMATSDLFDLEYLPSSGSGLSLVLIRDVDRETQDAYTLQVVASDGGSPSLTGTLTVHVQIVDANDNPPVFLQTSYNITVREDYSLYQTLVTVMATDMDQGPNGEVFYSLSPQTLDKYNDLFSVRNRTGEVFLRHPLDYAQGTRYELLVVAEDRGQDSLQAHATVIINVEDVNNHPPEITVSPVVAGQTIGVKENSLPGAIAAVVSIQDLDPGNNGNCDCEIVDSNFALEELYTNGYKVVSKQVFDREQQESYQVVIQCEDRGTPVLRSQKQVTIAVLDVNDHAPQFDSTPYRVQLQENTTAGITLLRVGATDADEGDNAYVVYSLEQSAARHLSINSDTGVVTLTYTVDYEESPFLEYRVLARDRGTPSRTATTEIRIDIIDINDEPPIFQQKFYNFGTYENQPNNTEIGTVTATDRDSSPNDKFAYSLYGEQNVLDVFSVDPLDGRITARASLDREVTAAYSMIVIATNVRPPQLSASVSVTIYVADKNDNAPVISFPNNENRTLDISIFTPVEYIVSRIVASDSDLGNNAKLTYALNKDYGVFALDPILGHLYIKSSLSVLLENSLDLHVIVSDNGSPALSTTASLRVNINRTMDFAKEHNLLPLESNEGLSQHETILIILGAVTAVLVSVLVAAIVLVKKRQLRHAKEIDTMQRVDSTQKASHDASFEGVSVISDNSSLWASSKNDGNPPPYRELNKTNHNNKQGSVTESNTSKELVTQVSNNLNKPSLQLPSHMHHPHEQDSDSASRCSAEISNTDSGHGPSEEGDPHDHVLHLGGGIRPKCPVHGGTEVKTNKPSTTLPHLQMAPLHTKRLGYPVLTSHEQGATRPSSGVPKSGIPHLGGTHAHNNVPGVHGLKSKPMSDNPPDRPPKPIKSILHNRSYPINSDYPTDSWRPGPPPPPRSKTSSLSSRTGTGSGQRPSYGSGQRLNEQRDGPLAWDVRRHSGLTEESDDDDGSSSEGSFVIDLGDIKSVNV